VAFIISEVPTSQQKPQLGNRKQGLHPEEQLLKDKTNRVFNGVS